MRKAGEEEDWKKKTGDRRGWKRLSDEAVKKLRAAPHPLKKGNEEERERNVRLGLFQTQRSFPNMLMSRSCGVWKTKIYWATYELTIPVT